MKVKPKSKLSKPKSGLVLPGPDELNQPPDSLSSYVVALYGRKGIGKTSLAASFPGAIIGQAEEGRKNLEIRQYPLWEEDWPVYREFIEKCIDDDTVETVGIDTIDRWYDKCLAYCCDEMGVAHPNDANDYGKTWNEIYKKFSGVLNSVSRAGKGLIVLSHANTRTVETRVGDSYDEIEPSCQKGPRKWMQEVCDLVFYYDYHEKHRSISVRPISEANTECWCSCGPGSTHFRDPAGEPLSIFHINDNDPKKAYADLEAAFHNKLWDAVRGKPATVKKKRQVDDE